MARDVEKVAESGFKELVAAALGCLEGELEHYERQAFSANAAKAQACDLGHAVEAARRFGYLEAVCAVLDRVVEDPPESPSDLPAAARGPNTPNTALARAMEILAEARRLCPKDGPGDSLGTAIWLLGLRAEPAARPEP